MSCQAAGYDSCSSVLVLLVEVSLLLTTLLLPSHCC